MRNIVLILTCLSVSLISGSIFGSDEPLVPRDRLFTFPVQSKTGFNASFDKTEALSATGGWVGQKTIVAEEGDNPLDEASLQMDTTGTMWAMWMIVGVSDGFALTHFTDQVWAPPQIVFPNTLVDNFRLRFAIAENDSFWLVWHRRENGGREIYYSRGDGVSWSPPQIVHAPNTDYDFAPRIGTGGGKVWVTWYRNNADFSQSHVYVTHWTGGGWAPEEDLTAEIPGYHWFSNIAVGADGTAHVVWGDSENGYIYYEHSLEEGGWTEPQVINPVLFRVAAGGWPAPVICVDPAGTLHAAWVGQRVVSGNFEDWDIYYSHSYGSAWSAPVQVNPDDELTDAYPDIRASAPNNVWITWYDGDPASVSWDVKAMAVHWDGNQALGVYRLDNGEYGDNGLIGGLGLDAFQNPWAVWSTIGVDFGPGAIVYNFWDPTVPVEWTNFRGMASDNRVELDWWASPRAFVYFDIEKLVEGNYVFLNRIAEDGRGDYSWRENAPSGVWSYRIRGLRPDGSVGILGPVTVEVLAIPKEMKLELVTRDVRETIPLRVGLPESETLSLDLVDLVGRKLAHRDLPVLTAGWHQVELGLPRPSPASGMYWIQGKAGRHRAAAGWLYLR